MGFSLTVKTKTFLLVSRPMTNLCEQIEALSGFWPSPVIFLASKQYLQLLSCISSQFSDSLSNIHMFTRQILIISNHFLGSESSHCHSKRMPRVSCQ